MKQSRLHWFLLRHVLEGVFRFAWPLAARLPPAVGRGIAQRLGDLCAHLDLDWRTVALRRHYVAGYTRQALLDIEPGIAPDRLDVLVRERFRSAACEELEGHWLALGRTRAFCCNFEGLEEVRAALAHGRGIVLLTMHFDAVAMGVAHLGQAGMRLNLMTSKVVEDARVPRVVQQYFAAKYAGISAHLNGGQTLHVEDHLKTFYRALRAGEGVVILGEAPASRTNDALIVNFLGRRRAFVPGAVRLAEKTGASLAAFVCITEADGCHRLVFSPAYRPVRGRHDQSATAAFGFLEAQVRRFPGRWWAADLLPNFISLD